MKISRVITAIGNPILNEKLVENNIKVACNDIQYKEGILEYLEKDSNIKFIIIDEKIPGNIDTNELITLIKKIESNIKIILISEQSKYDVYKIYKNLDIEEILRFINKENIYNQNTIPPIVDFNQNKTKESKVITILGPNGIGKSVFSITLSNNIENRKILIIDFDILNNSLHTLLGVNEYSKKLENNLKKSKNKVLNPYEFDINDFIIKTKFNLDLISGINLIFDFDTQVSPTKMRNLIEKIKYQYDYIIIDTSSECFLDYTRELIKISDKCIFISGANMLEVKKSQKLLQIYDEEWNIKNKEIDIIFNKCTKQSIDDEILKQLFKGNKILGKIKLTDYYDLAINNNNLRKKEIEEDIKKIREKIFYDNHRIIKFKKLTTKT